MLNLWALVKFMFLGLLVPPYYRDSKYHQFCEFWEFRSTGCVLGLGTPNTLKVEGLRTPKTLNISCRGYQNALDGLPWSALICYSLPWLLLAWLLLAWLLLAWLLQA